MLSKNSAGYGSNNLVLDSFKDLSAQLKQDSSDYSAEELANQLRNAEIREHNADANRAFMDNLPTPPTGNVGGPAAAGGANPPA